MGSTEESAVDPLADVLELRERCRAEGLDFMVHADAAWGGYFASMLREDDEAAPAAPAGDAPRLAMSRYVVDQYVRLGDADSITVDPHKAGYVPYPAGGLCYRNSALRNLVSFTAPVVYHNTADPTVGIYGVEGSKPGAAAAAVYLSHRVIRPTRAGYGKILGECLFGSKRLYCRLVTLRDERFAVTPVHRLPAEKAGQPAARVEEQVEFIRQRVVGRSDADLLADPEAMALFQELGSDQVIVPFALNPREPDGRPNRSVARANALNARVFEILSIKPGEDVNTKDLIVTSSRFEPRVYGPAFMRTFRARMGLEGDEDIPIDFLVSTTMDPWLRESGDWSFLEVIERALRAAAHRALDDERAGHR
jgi:hypothetical protein